MMRFSRSDKILLIIIGILCAVVLIAYMFWPKRTASQVEILVEGKLVQTCDLNQDQTVPIKVGGKTTNILEIVNKQAYMKEADCPDHLCMKQGKISHGGESIVCLPNRVVVQVKSEEKSEYDSVAE